MHGWFLTDMEILMSDTLLSEHNRMLVVINDMKPPPYDRLVEPSADV